MALEIPFLKIGKFIETRHHLFRPVSPQENSLSAKNDRHPALFKKIVCLLFFFRKGGGKPASISPASLFQRTAKAKRDSLANQSPQIGRKSTRLNSSHSQISDAVFCL